MFNRKLSIRDLKKTSEFQNLDSDAQAWIHEKKRIRAVKLTRVRVLKDAKKKMKRTAAAYLYALGSQPSATTTYQKKMRDESMMAAALYGTIIKM